MKRVVYCRRRVLVDAAGGGLAGEDAGAALEEMLARRGRVPGGPGFVRAGSAGGGGNESGTCRALGRDEARPSRDGSTVENGFGGEWGWEDQFVLRPEGVEVMRLARAGEARPVKGVRATPSEAWAETPTPAGARWGEVRELLACGDAEGALVCRGMGLLNWRRDHVFCGRCGGRLEESETELMARRCPRCGQTEWPDVIPAVIVRLEREGKVLLARHTYRNPEMFACIAGHFEAGENAEECVRREVKEETGLETGRVEYLGSQHWPFPNMLMLAFRAECTGGELKLQAEELAEARWFPADALPDNMPKPGSVAWRILRGDLAGRG